MTSICKCSTWHLLDIVDSEWLSEVLDEASTRATLWTVQNEQRLAEGRNSLDETIYNESFWMGVDVTDDNNNNYDAEAEEEADDN